MKVMKRELELYIHIPFCQRKCVYCDFLSFVVPEEERRNYVSAMIQELNQYKSFAEGYIVTTVFFGGGTPSLLEVDLMREIFSEVKEVFTLSDDVEITIEMNPGTVDEEKIAAYKAMGINRVSIGLQATNDEELKMLGRIHKYQDFLDTYDLVKKYGMDNINVDLISAIPKQTVASWGETLDRVIALNPTHISAYSLIVEEGTSLYENLGEYEDLMPSEEAERAMYYMTKQKLDEAGYDRYEISNYAKKGCECRHNIGYWERVEYLGVGLGAASLIHNTRYTNETDMARYITKCEGKITVRIQEESLSKETQMEEYMFLGLREIKGVSLSKFEELFQVKLEIIYRKPLQKLYKQGLVVQEQDAIKLTEQGIDVSNYVLSEFLF